MIELAIISGTDRPGAQALKISGYLMRRYKKMGAKVSLINLQDFPLEAVKGGPYGQDNSAIEAYNKPLHQADGLVMVIPEYNGSFPGILKLFIDYLPFPESFLRKPISYIGESAGAFGAMRAVEQMEQVAEYRYAYNFPERVFIPRVNKNFSEDKGILDEFQNSLLDSQIKNFYHFVENLKQQYQFTS